MIQKIKVNFSISYVLLTGLLLFIIWALIFDIDKSVRSQGVVVATKNNQIIQVADGGILENILVSEGDIVYKNQQIASLENKRIEADYKQIQVENAYLQSLINRIDAQILNKNIVFSKEIDNYPAFIKAQNILFLQQTKALSQKVNNLNKLLKIAKKRLKINQELIKNGDIAELEILQLSEKILDIEVKINDIKNNYQDKLKSEKEKVVAELIKNSYKLKQQFDVLKHTKIFSPVNGVVKELKITTIGGVLKAGDALMEVSPSAGGIILQAKINPSDIADIKLKIPVIIKLDAFDYSVFGSLNGEVEYISSDTLREKDPSGKMQIFYQVNVLITSKNPKIIPKLGMSAMLEIKTGSRSLFNYLTKPIIRGFSGSLSEK
jgi:adhesin transport system membrane fusion protein